LPPGGHISTELRINDRIRVPEVRLVGPNGETVGIVPTDQALKLAQEADLDLVEIAPQGKPPVCKLMDYGKFKYENAQKAREARRNQTNVIIKEMKLRPKIDAHDYETKKGHVVRFLRAVTRSRSRSCSVAVSSPGRSSASGSCSDLLRTCRSSASSSPRRSRTVAT
jgi:translation initiation factor IF-3